MKKLMGLFAVLFVLIAFTGCTSVNSSDGGDMNILPKTVAPNIAYRPLYDVDKTNRVTAQSNVKCLFWIFTWGSDNSFADNADVTAKQSFFASIFPFINAEYTASKAAFYKACKQNNCDAILAARYEITKKDYFIFKKLNVEIKGYPGKQTGLEAVEVKNCVKENEAKKNILGTLGTLGL